MDGKGKKIHILYVDDDPVMLQLFGGQLVRKGFEVIYAHNGAEGWELARKIKPDLILLDYRMEGMDGMEAAEHLKSEEDTKDIPIIMLSSEDFSVDATKYLKEIGVEDYVHKGMLFDELFARIKALLEAKEIPYEEPKEDVA